MKQQDTIHLFQLGQISYQQGLVLQDALVRDVQEEKRTGALLLLEHDPVITMGRGTHSEHILQSRQALEARGISLYQSSRGGDVTYHGPGQLVAYPIINLNRKKPDLHNYMRCLEETIIQALSHFGIAGGRQEGMTGVWVGPDENGPPRKIAAIGIHVQRWVTSHGFALNVNGSLDAFQLIVPCGLHGRQVTSLSRETGIDQDMGKVREAVVKAFSEVFQMQTIPRSPGDLPVNK